jgi:hypothetical protein
MTKEVWVVKDKVTNPHMHHMLGYPEVEEGQTEWQFSNGPRRKRDMYKRSVSLAEGLRDYSGYVVHWDMSNSLLD